jgi:hypothetical protein
MYRRDLQPIFVEYRRTLGPNLRLLHDPILRLHRRPHRRSDRPGCSFADAPASERIKSLLRWGFDTDANLGVPICRGANHCRHRFNVSLLQIIRTAYVRAQIDLPSS